MRGWPFARRLESRPDLFAGALLLGSPARGDGDAISDVDLVAVTHPGTWQALPENPLSAPRAIDPLR